MKVYIDEGDLRMFNYLVNHVGNFSESSFNNLIGSDYQKRLERIIDEVEK